MIATGYAVLSHGTKNKLHHPDILTGILSLGSLGPANILHGALVTWAVNVLELLHEMQDNQVKLSIMNRYSHTDMYDDIAIKQSKRGKF